jgi:hypothetical protein
MNEPPRSCCCWAGQASWRLRPDDRFCGQCGRRLVTATPRAPVLSPGDPEVIALYLRAGPAPGRYGGSLHFQVAGLRQEVPTVSWKSLVASGLRVHSAQLQSPTLLEVLFRLEGRTPLSPGGCGCGQLAVRFRNERFDFLVHAFVIEGLPGKVWTGGQAGDRQPGTDLVIYRGAELGATFLEFELGAGIPVQWESLTCAHPAVTPQPLQTDRGAPVARARVHWHPGRLDRDAESEELVFRLALRGLPVQEFPQRVGWRRRQPLLCEPSGLVVPLLVGDRPAVHEVRLTNVDPQPLLLERIEPGVPWVGEKDPAPVYLGPGQSASVRLEVRPAALNGAAPPHRGGVAFCFAGKGRQPFPVRVDAVRRLRPLSGPLLLDPGPPRIVLGRVDPRTGQVVYLPSSGDAGLEPAQLGVAPQEYARAVYEQQGARSLCRELIARVFQRVRDWEQLEARAVLVCRQPWLAKVLPPSSRFACDWQSLCRRWGSARHAPSPQVGLIRLDAWGASVQAGDGEPETDAPGPSLGSALAGWLGRRYGLADAPRHAPAGWVRLAIEELLHDYRWGAAHAWRRLLAAWQEHIPPLRRLPHQALKAGRPGRQAAGRQGRSAFPLREADAYLRGCVAEQARRLAELAWGLAARRGAGPAWLWVSPLFGSRPVVESLRSGVGAFGGEPVCVAPLWVEWLGREVACRAGES